MRTRMLAPVLGVLAALALGAPSLQPREAGAADPTGGSCAWFLPLHSNGANALYLDQSVTYWVTRIPYVPGEKLTLRGQYPHARYFSITAYDPRTRALSSLYDAQIQPDQGSSNPFTAGADRTVAQRAYTVTVSFLQPGQQPSAAPNQLATGFTGAGVPATDFFLVYRVYLPDQGLDAAGGRPLPSVTASAPVLGEAAFPSCPAGYQPPPTVNQAIAESGSPAPLPKPAGGTDPVWHKFYNFPTSAANGADSSGQTNFAGTVSAYTMKTGQGGYLEDLENAYLYTFLNAPSGPLVVIRAQAFSYPDTYAGAPVMPGGKDMRYWSLCSYDPVSQRNYACTPDFRAAPQGGTYTIVVSTPANKPPQLCGATWLPFGPAAQSLLIFRNQLGTSPNSVQKVELGHETAMGAFYPAARYLDQAAYRGQVCGTGDAATGNPASPAGDPMAAGGDVPPADLGSSAGGDFGGAGGFGGFDMGGVLPADAVPPPAEGGADASTGAPADAGMEMSQGAVLAASARAPREPKGNLPLGLSLTALVLGTLGIGIRRKLAA